MFSIGHYNILEELGEGSFGKVFKAENKRSKNIVAIKVQFKEQSMILKHEAKIYKYLSDVSGIPMM